MQSEKKMNKRKLIITAIGSLIGIGIVTFISDEYSAPLLIASFGATAVLIYAIPESPLARPKNVFFGHLISAIVGVLCFLFLGGEWYSMTIAVTLAIVLMAITNTLHPPGGATSLACVMSSATLSFILMPVMVGVSIMMCVAYAMNMLSKKMDENETKDDR